MNKKEMRYRENVEHTGEYEYKRSFRKGEILPNGKTVNHSPYIQITHMYCGTTYETNASGFINSNKRCSHCCGSYEKSFAYHIEKELGLNIGDVWDFEKNTVNPYHISRNRNAKDYNKNDMRVWIKCIEKDYHGSYLTSCSHFVGGQRCSYCNPTGKSPKVHPLDSFAQYHIDNTDPNFLEKYWDWDKNNELGIDPWRITTRTDSLKVFIKCKKSKHGSYDVAPIHFTKSMSRCPMCRSSKGEKIIEKWLTNHNITFIKDKRYFNDLVSIRNTPLRPDFILEKEKIWIEYDGEFHYQPILGEKELNDLQYHDRLKNEYAEKNGWRMIRIPYWEFDKIEEILDKNIEFKEGEELK